MSLKHAILGFLSYKSLSGYELKKAFDRSVSHFWPADQSQIYRTLKELHQEKLITRQIIPHKERLDVKVYAIAEAGQIELRQWLSTPLPPADTRDPFLVQLYFGFLLQDVQVGQLLQRELDQLDSLLKIYESVYLEATSREQTDEDKRPIFYSMLTLEFGIKANVWYRGWLQSVKERIEAGDMAVLPLAELLNSSNR
jgi:PadR family transcriptional regulator, regulatory protein AphA